MSDTVTQGRIQALLDRVWEAEKWIEDCEASGVSYADTSPSDVVADLTRGEAIRQADLRALAAHKDALAAALRSSREPLLDALPWNAAERLLAAAWTATTAADAVSTEADYLYGQSDDVRANQVERFGLTDPKGLARWIATNYLGDLRAWLDTTPETKEDR